MNTVHQSVKSPGRPRSTYASVAELADELRLSRGTVYAALRDGRIPALRVGKKYILSRAAIAEWLRTAGGRPGFPEIMA